MTSITITENQSNEDGLLYVQTSGSELFLHAGASARLVTVGDRSILTVNCPEYYLDIIRAEIADKVAEIIAIKYKYEYFKKNLHVGGLSSVEKEILLTSLIAADLDDDKKYAYDRVKCCREISIDGTYNFRLKPLRKKWDDVVDCIPGCFLNSQLKEFISYLTENKKKRVFVEHGRVYDSHYRRLKRSSLLGGEKIKIIREVLLSNCGEVELLGELPDEDEYFLKEYYNDKIIFSGGELN